MIDRRGFFANLLAAAAAFVVAPKVAGAEGRPQDTPIRDQTGLYVRDGELHMAVNGYDVGSAQPVIDEARAEGYERGRAVEAAARESRSLHLEG